MSKKKSGLKKASTKKPKTKKTTSKKVSKKKAIKNNIKIDSNPKEILANDAKQKEINPLEKEIMLILSNNPAGIMQTEIYEEVGVSKKNRTMTLLSRMSKDGIIRRERKGRSFLVFVV